MLHECHTTGDAYSSYTCTYTAYTVGAGFFVVVTVIVNVVFHTTMLYYIPVFCVTNLLCKLGLCSLRLAIVYGIQGTCLHGLFPHRMLSALMCNCKSC